jgi:hypothetical protein
MTTDPARLRPPLLRRASKLPPERRLLELIARTLKLLPDSIGEHSDMHNTRRWDSLRHVLLMTEIELGYAIGSKHRARFGYTRNRWRESVVAGTNARFARHSRLSSCRIRSTRLWFTAQPDRFSSTVIRR